MREAKSQEPPKATVQRKQAAAPNVLAVVTAIGRLPAGVTRERSA